MTDEDRAAHARRLVANGESLEERAKDSRFVLGLLDLEALGLFAVERKTDHANLPLGCIEGGLAPGGLTDFFALRRAERVAPHLDGFGLALELHLAGRVVTEVAQRLLLGEIARGLEVLAAGFDELFAGAGAHVREGLDVEGDDGH